MDKDQRDQLVMLEHQGTLDQLELLVNGVITELPVHQGHPDLEEILDSQGPLDNQEHPVLLDHQVLEEM